MAFLRKVSSSFDDDDITVTTLRGHSSRSSATVTLVDDLPSDRKVDSNSTAIGSHYQRMTAECPQSEPQPWFPKSPNFCLFNQRSCREAVAVAPNRSRFPSVNDVASESRLTVTGRHISSATPVDSSAIPDIAALPLEYEEGKTKSWSGPCRQLKGPDVSVPKAGTSSKPSRFEFSYACRRECKARCKDEMPSCAQCLAGSETCSLNKHGIDLSEHARGEEAMDEEEAVTMEEPCSHFSDDSTDEADDGDNVPSTARLFNSLGRLNQRSKTRLSWSNLFSKS